MAVPPVLRQAKIDVDGLFTVEVLCGNPVQGEMGYLPWLIVHPVRLNPPDLMQAVEKMTQTGRSPVRQARLIREPYSDRELIQVTVVPTAGDLHTILTLASKVAADIVALLL